MELRVLAASLHVEPDASVEFDAGLDGVQHMTPGRRFYVECEVTVVDSTPGAERIVVIPRTAVGG